MPKGNQSQKEIRDESKSVLFDTERKSKSKGNHRRKEISVI